MEKFLSGLLAAILLLCLSVGQCLSDDMLQWKSISEKEVRIHQCSNLF